MAVSDHNPQTINRYLRIAHRKPMALALFLLAIVFAHTGCMHGSDRCPFDDAQLQVMRQIDAIEQKMLYVRVLASDAEVEYADAAASVYQSGFSMYWPEDMEPAYEAWLEEFDDCASVYSDLYYITGPPQLISPRASMIGYTFRIRELGMELESVLEEAATDGETYAKTYERLFPWRNFERSVCYQTRYGIRFKQDGNYLPDVPADKAKDLASDIGVLAQIDDLERQLVYARMKMYYCEAMLAGGIGMLDNLLGRFLYPEHMEMVSIGYQRDFPIAMNDELEERIRLRLAQTEDCFKGFEVCRVDDKEKFDEIMKRNPFWRPATPLSPFSEMMHYFGIELCLREEMKDLLHGLAREGETEQQTYERLVSWREYKKSVYYQIEYGVQDIKEDEMLPQEEPEQENMDEQQSGENESPDEETHDGSRPDSEPNDDTLPEYREQEDMDEQQPGEDEKPDEETHDGSLPDLEPDESDKPPEEPEESR